MRSPKLFGPVAVSVLAVVVVLVPLAPAAAQRDRISPPSQTFEPPAPEPPPPPPRARAAAASATAAAGHGLAAYSLGFVPERPRAGGERRIAVVVKGRPGLTVRARELRPDEED
jgi:hypothetical protein